MARKPWISSLTDPRGVCMGGEPAMRGAQCRQAPHINVAVEQVHFRPATLAEAIDGLDGAQVAQLGVGGHRLPCYGERSTGGSAGTERRGTWLGNCPRGSRARKRTPEAKLRRLAPTHQSGTRELDGTETLVVGTCRVGNSGGLDLVAKARIVGGIVSRDASIGEGETEQAGCFLFADFSCDAKRLAGQAVVIGCSLLCPSEDLTDVISRGYVIGHECRKVLNIDMQADTDNTIGRRGE